MELLSLYSAKRLNMSDNPPLLSPNLRACRGCVSCRAWVEGFGDYAQILRAICQEVRPIFEANKTRQLAILQLLAGTVSEACMLLVQDRNILLL